AAVYRLAMLVKAGAPGVVPQTAPVRLLFETNDVGHRLTCLGGRLESAKLSQATGSCTDDTDTLSHVFPLKSTAQEPGMYPVGHKAGATLSAQGRWRG